jgi:hypothetical protein
MPSEPRHSSVFNLLSLSGIALATAGAIVFLIFFVRDLAGAHTSPYFGIVTFILLPAVFVAGLLLIPAGIYRERRRRVREAAAAGEHWPLIDLRHAPTRRVIITIGLLTIFNVGIVAMAGYQSLEFVDSRTFCTGVCHTPMEPQAVAHQRSVHANISCASCHVGEGPPGFVRAKLGGVRRLTAIATGDYRRPIPSPVADLPAATATCMHCHNREKYFGDLVRPLRSYTDDEANTEQITTLTMRAGGGGWEAGGPHGIHWHASPWTRVEYIATDATRETIPWVQVTDVNGTVTEYVADGVEPAALEQGERRVMDCTDCHNRQGHAIATTADRAVDEALARGLIPRTLPFVRREVLAALQEVSGERADVEGRIANRLRTFYDAQPSNGAAANGTDVAQAIAAAQRLYAGNVFPRMNVTWGTYPSQLGHTDSNGCFRCHDDLHKSKSGTVISQDCEMCHKVE